MPTETLTFNPGQLVLVYLRGCKAEGWHAGRFQQLEIVKAKTYAIVQPIPVRKRKRNWRADLTDVRTV